MGPVDWLEGSVYMGLLSVAGFVCVLRLLGARLLPRKASEGGDAVAENSISWVRIRRLWRIGAANGAGGKARHRVDPMHAGHQQDKSTQ